MTELKSVTLAELLGRLNPANEQRIENGDLKQTLAAHTNVQDFYDFIMTHVPADDIDLEMYEAAKKEIVEGTSMWNYEVSRIHLERGSMAVNGTAHVLATTYRELVADWTCLVGILNPYLVSNLENAVTAQ